MSVYPKSALVFALFPISAFALPEIDSGGGKSSDGALFNHSSIGGPLATPMTLGGITANHPGLIEVIYPLTPSSITDVNENGLPDGWEISNFGPIGVDPSADADHDGTNNLMEYLAGTNPNSASSVFRPQGSYASGIFQMPVPTVSGRNYRIWVTRDLQQWTPQSTLTGDDTEQIFTFDETTIASGPLQSLTHPSHYFFRVQILIP